MSAEEKEELAEQVTHEFHRAREKAIEDIRRLRSEKGLMLTKEEEEAYREYLRAIIIEDAANYIVKEARQKVEDAMRTARLQKEREKKRIVLVNVDSQNIAYYLNPLDWKRYIEILSEGINLSMENEFERKRLNALKEEAQKLINKTPFQVSQRPEPLVFNQEYDAIFEYGKIKEISELSSKKLSNDQELHTTEK